MVEVFAEQLTFETAQEWASQAEYRLVKDELQKIFLPYREISSDVPGLYDEQTNVERLDLFPDQPLFGVDQDREQLRLVLECREAPWLIAFDGIGKTSLANAVVHETILTGRFHDVAWISAKQEEFLTDTGLRQTNRPVLDPETLIDGLLAHFYQKIKYFSN